MCDINLTVVKDDNDLLMTVTLIKGKPKANLKKLQKAFKSSEHSQFLLIDGAMESLLEELNNVDKSEQSDEKSTVSKVIANAVDASLSVTLDAKNMSATVKLIGGYGGRNINNTDVIELLKANNITKGIIKENLLNLVKQGMKLQGSEELSVEVAVGKISINGKDGYIRYLVEDPIDRILRPKRLDNGKVDMRELGNLVHVKKGTQLAKLMPPTIGIKGFTVTGSVIEAIPGKACSLEESEGSSFLDEGMNILIANINGMPKHLDNSVTVNTVLELENIDVGTGNIRFDGSVYVKGNVYGSMKLSASEDIVVGGTVESAMIVTGGNLSIAHGIIGRQISEEGELENSAMLEVGGSLSAQFVQYADIVAQKDIRVSQYISHSQIIVEDDLWVGNVGREKADGKLFGTCVQAGGSIYVGILGSPCGALTSLNLNYWVGVSTELRNNADVKIRETVRTVNKIYGLLANPDAQYKVKVEQIEGIINALKRQLTLLGKLNKTWLEKDAKINDHLDELEISVYQSILSGVDISVSSRACVFKRDYEATKIQWFENQLSVEPIIN